MIAILWRLLSALSGLAPDCALGRGQGGPPNPCWRAPSGLGAREPSIRPSPELELRGPHDQEVFARHFCARDDLLVFAGAPVRWRDPWRLQGSVPAPSLGWLPAQHGRSWAHENRNDRSSRPLAHPFRGTRAYSVVGRRRRKRRALGPPAQPPGGARVRTPVPPDVRRVVYISSAT